MACGICLGPFVQPVRVFHQNNQSDLDHLFCKRCLRDWLWTCISLGQHPSCPYCTQPLNPQLPFRETAPLGLLAEYTLSINNFIKSLFENKKIYGPIFVVLAVIGSKIVTPQDWVSVAGLVGALFGVFVLHAVTREPPPEAMHLLT